MSEKTNLNSKGHLMSVLLEGPCNYRAGRVDRILLRRQRVMLCERPNPDGSGTHWAWRRGPVPARTPT
jgi:hypothetical protein